MSNFDNVANASKTARVCNVVPFTGGLMVIYAFFWPESCGHWLGTIVHSFRAAAGI